MTVIKIMDKVCVLTAIVGIIVLEVFALSKGINGTALSLTIAAVAGLGGYKMDKIIEMVKGGKE